MRHAQASGNARAEGDIAGGGGKQSPNTLIVRIVAKPRPCARDPARASAHATAEDFAVQSPEGTLPRVDRKLCYTIDVHPGQSPDQTIGLGDKLVGSQILAGDVVRLSFERCAQPPAAPWPGAARGRRLASPRGARWSSDIGPVLRASGTTQEDVARSPSPSSPSPASGQRDGPEEPSCCGSGIRAVRARFVIPTSPGSRDWVPTSSSPRSPSPSPPLTPSRDLHFTPGSGEASPSTPESSARPRQRPWTAHAGAPAGRGKPGTSPADREFDEWREHLMMEAAARAQERALQHAADWPTIGGARHVAAAGNTWAAAAAKAPLTTRHGLRHGAVAGRCNRSPRGLMLGSRATSGNPAMHRSEEVCEATLLPAGTREESNFQEEAELAADWRHMMHADSSEARGATSLFSSQEAQWHGGESLLGESHEQQFASWSADATFTFGHAGAATRAPPTDLVPPVPPAWSVAARPLSAPG